MSNSSSQSGAMLGPVRVWALAAGGVVGGGIYIALGVVIAVAGQWAWLSFVISGVIAVISAFSYAWLSRESGKSGGAFAFLEDMGREGLAGSLSWLLMIGYTRRSRSLRTHSGTTSRMRSPVVTGLSAAWRPRSASG